MLSRWKISIFVRITVSVICTNVGFEVDYLKLNGRMGLFTVVSHCGLNVVLIKSTKCGQKCANMCTFGE